MGRFDSALPPILPAHKETHVNRPLVSAVKGRPFRLRLLRRRLGVSRERNIPGEVEPRIPARPRTCMDTHNRPLSEAYLRISFPMPLRYIRIITANAAVVQRYHPFTIRSRPSAFALYSASSARVIKVSSGAPEYAATLPKLAVTGICVPSHSTGVSRMLCQIYATT